MSNINVLARECKLMASKIERQFGTAQVSRSEMLRDAVMLQSQSKRLADAMREWFDEMSRNPLTRD